MRALAARSGFLLIILLAPWPSTAEDWPSWRGPRGDGTSTEENVPTRWNSTENIAWQVRIPGVGHASPIVSGDRVFVVTSLPQSNQRLLLCLDRATGRIVWRVTALHAPPEAMHRLNSCASSTPATDGQFIFVSFLEPGETVVPAEVIRRQSGDLIADNAGMPVTPGRMFVAAYDMDGNRRWVARPGNFASVWGYCSSPVVFEDRLILNGDHDGDAYLVALDCTTGETVWKVKREHRIRSYCTPLIRVLDGRRQMIVAGSHSVVSYDPRDGSRHWFIDGPRGRAVASPVLSGDLLLIVAGYPNREMLAIRPDGHGDISATHVQWRSRKACPFVPSPIAVNNCFLLVSDQGIATCMDAESGNVHWRQRIGSGYSASPVSAAGLVYFLADDGVTTIIPARTEFRVHAKNSIDEPCYASPAISGGQMFLRSEKQLYCIGTGRPDGIDRRANGTLDLPTADAPRR